MKKYILVFAITIILSSCLLRKNKQYESDYYKLNTAEFNQKYYSLYGKQNLDFSSVKKNEPYLTYTNNNTFQILVFSDDGYIYDSQLMPQKIFGKIPRNQLSRNGLYSIDGDIFKREQIATSLGDVYSIIEEGNVRNDTIFMKKSYHSKGYKNTRNLFSQYVYCPEVKLFKLGDDFFVESGK